MIYYWVVDCLTVNIVDKYLASWFYDDSLFDVGCIDDY